MIKHDPNKWYQIFNMKAVGRLIFFLEIKLVQNMFWTNHYEEEVEMNELEKLTGRIDVLHVHPRYHA